MDKYRTKNINIIEKEIVEINNKIVETEKYRNRKYEIDAEKEQILSELKELEQQKQILQELQNSMKSEEETKNRLEIREKNRKENIAKINELTNQKNTINAESERVQSAKNHLQDIIKGHKENIEKLNSEIEKIANEKEETQEKEKPSICHACGNAAHVLLESIVHGIFSVQRGWIILVQIFTCWNILHIILCR